MLPDLSIERTFTGKAPGLRSAVIYAVPRGPITTPVPARSTQTSGLK